MQTCLTCEKTFGGRSNQKFCSVSCKNKHHNTQNKTKEAVVLTINKALHKNWTVLNKLYQIYRSTPISVDVANAYGYDMNYFTHIHNSPIGEKYTMVYDIGFKHHIDNRIQIFPAP
ncbi:MAG: hypothetical protein IPM77_03210 [Crocinitomicaceae bacterium]|nr:hypothetical protein [Crocinitomicaceae bacterium]